MTGYRSSTFRHNCDIRGCFIQALPDWDDIVKCFGGRVIPTDIDAMVERNGRFLFLEQKQAGVPFEAGGQYWALRRLGALPGVTVKVLRPAGGDQLDVLTWPKPGEFRRISRPTLRLQLRAWDAGLA